MSTDVEYLKLRQQMDEDMSVYARLGRRAQRRWRSRCCQSPKPWKHSIECPLVRAVQRFAARP